MKYSTSHELARQLLAGPDLRVAIVVPTFDCPGSCAAHPVKLEPVKIEGIDCVIVTAGTADSEAPVEPTSPATAECTCATATRGGVYPCPIHGHAEIS